LPKFQVKSQGYFNDKIVASLSINNVIMLNQQNSTWCNSDADSQDDDKLQYWLEKYCHFTAGSNYPVKTSFGW
jgi:hypothetical protein